MTTAARSGLVAVLFTDLVGSTELMTQLGERDFDEVRRDHFAALGRAVAAHGGEEVKNTGDGILAVFPSAGEAVEAAVDMQQTTSRPRGDVRLAMRVGVAVGDATLEDGDVFGAPVVEAARLVAEARPGQILATAVVRTLGGSRTTAGFADLGSLELRGLAEPVAVCEVEWAPLPAAFPMPPLLARTGRVFVGRDAELERLAQLWKEAAAGERRVALVAGEPGIGKTRLAAMAARAAHEGGGVVLAGRCDEDLGVPYQPFVEALRHYVLYGGLESRLGRHGGELVRLVPEVADTIPGLAPPLRSDPETERYRLFDALAAWLADVSAEVPVLLVLDDLQWAAKPTLLLLRHVLRSPEAMSLLVIVTYRDTDVGRGHRLSEFLADLRREQGVERLSLVGLDVPGVADYLIQASGHDLDEEGEELARAVWRETEGLPFFVAEVMRHLTESGGVEQRDGRWVVTGDVEQLGIPEGIRDVVGRRLSRLSAATNRVLACASVAGLEFEPGVVQAAGGFDGDAVFSALEEGIAARLLAEVPGPVPRNRFAHALVRTTLYDELSAARRVDLHHKVGQAIEAVHAEALDDYLPALAHHWARASAPAAHTTKAVEYATRAGDRALAQLAHDEAVGYYRQALNLMDVAQDELSQGHRLKLLIALGEAQKRAGDASHRGTLLEAGRVACEAGDAEAAAQAALVNQRGHFSSLGDVDVERVDALEAALAAVGGGEAGLRARLMAALANELYFTDDRRRHALADDALTLARTAKDPATVAEVLAAVWYARWGPGIAQNGSALVTELADLARKLGDPLLEFQAGMAIYLTGMQRGDFQEADAGLDTCIKVSEELSQPVLRWRTRRAQATRAVAAGRFDEAERMIEEAWQLGTAAGQPDAEAYRAAGVGVLRLLQGRPEDAVALEGSFAEVSATRTVMSWAYAELGRVAKARTVLENLRAAGFGTIPKDYLWLITCTGLTRASALLGDVQSAAELYELLLPHGDEMSQTQNVWAGPVAHDLAVLATRLGRLDDADSHFSDAEETQARIGAAGTLMHTRLEWARMLLTRRETGDVERARDLLAQALATARELGLANVERRAVELAR